MTEALYRKVMRGKRPTYQLVGNGRNWHDDIDVLAPGQFRLEFASHDGMRRYAHGVTPDTAGWAAAAMLAQTAMEKAMRHMARATPQDKARPYTKKELAIIERYRDEMHAIQSDLPDWWKLGSAHEIAQAGIDAVKNYKP